MSLNVESNKFFLALSSWDSFVVGVVGVIIVGVVIIVVIVDVVFELLIVVFQCMRLPLLKKRLDELLLLNCLLLHCLPLN